MTHSPVMTPGIARRSREKKANQRIADAARELGRKWAQSPLSPSDLAEFFAMVEREDRNLKKESER